MPAQPQSLSMGDRLSQLRRDRGLTQAQLAKQTGLSASAIAMYETNRRTPDRAAVKKLASVLKVRMAVLEGQSALPDPAAASPAQARAPKPAARRQPEPLSRPSSAQSDSPSVAQPDSSLTQLALTMDEARIILFLRMNPSAMPFIQSYIAATGKRREQLERTWRIIHEFQTAESGDA